MIDSFRNTDTELFVKPLPAVLNVAQSLHGLVAKAEQKGLEFHLEELESGACLLIDKAKFERAVANLVSNAVDAAESRMLVKLSLEGRDLVCAVTDDGPGISDELAPRIFQRGATHGKVDGTGLGLAYVRQIMRGHGGDVTYRRENKLTIFECRLPDALHFEKAQAVDKSTSLEAQIGQIQVQIIAICLEPSALAQSLVAKLASYKSDKFLFTEERNNASTVVSNIDEVMFEVLERDNQEYLSVAHLKHDEVAILKVLKRRYSLEGEDG